MTPYRTDHFFEMYGLLLPHFHVSSRLLKCVFSWTSFFSKRKKILVRNDDWVTRFLNKNSRETYQDNKHLRELASLF